MNLSPGSNFQDFKLTKSQTKSGFPKNRYLDCDILNEILEITNIQFEDDEYWLYKLSHIDENPIQNLKTWLYSNRNCSHEELVSSNIETDNQKNFDSRTFTRQKKRFTRPSIQKYNEVIYGASNNISTNDLHSSRESVSDSGGGFEISKSIYGETSTPLNFDLSQPSNSYYFENMLANIKDNDSFQNMSPPSLVNSICSTTFANLMENSFIKNDPVLREIRDTDFTESILLQDSEAPMFQSITESCSSLNSDTPESFLKKVSRSDTFKKKPSIDFEKTAQIGDSGNTSLHATYDINVNTKREAFDATQVVLHETVIPSQQLKEAHHQTLTEVNIKNSRGEDPNFTFSVSSNLSNNSENLDSHEVSNFIKPQLLKRRLIRENTIEDLKKQLNDTVLITDMNRLSYGLDVDKDTHQLNKTVEIKHSSASTGSTDSLDRMSSVSNSSRGSNRMLSLADVDAIVEMQEKSLQQVMSTPKIHSAPKKFWVNNQISPIISNERLSDSDISSAEEYKSVRSTISKGSLENFSQKSLEGTNYLEGTTARSKLTQQLFSYSNQKKCKGNSSNIRNANSNEKSIHLRNDGTLTVYKTGNNTEVAAPVTNLKLMGQKLKSSYTSLRPISTNLPVAPPINSMLNVTKTVYSSKQNSGVQSVESHTKIVEVHPMPREKITASDSNTFVKPVHSRTSCLPRPTGIPRPSSRIPAPRGNIRPTSSRSSTH